MRKNPACKTTVQMCWTSLSFAFRTDKIKEIPKTKTNPNSTSKGNQTRVIVGTYCTGIIYKKKIPISITVIKYAVRHELMTRISLGK